MEIKNKIQEDLKQALKAGDGFRTGVLRMMASAIQSLEIEKRGQGQEVKEEDLMAVLMKEAKKRKEAAELYQEGGRPELADKESQELEVIKGYLPEAPSQEEIEKAIEEAVAEGKKEFGALMKEVMGKFKGRGVSGQEVGEAIKKKLS